MSQHHNLVEYSVSGKVGGRRKRLLLGIRQSEETNDYGLFLSWVCVKLPGRIHEQIIDLSDGTRGLKLHESALRLEVHTGMFVAGVEVRSRQASLNRYPKLLAIWVCAITFALAIDIALPCPFDAVSIA